ncbi:hypothetical protein NG2371_05961 [Nocardia gamkensis]|nr:hypothetical protein [Nocardia gamkensis]
MNLREAAEELRIHHNTAKYRLERIQELTERNVRSANDLVELLVGVPLVRRSSSSALLVIGWGRSRYRRIERVCRKWRWS